MSASRFDREDRRERSRETASSSSDDRNPRWADEEPREQKRRRRIVLGGGGGGPGPGASSTSTSKKSSGFDVLPDASEVAELDNPNINKYTKRPYSSKYFDIQTIRQKLPITEAKRTLVKLIKKNKIVLVVGETGSGKTTQTPQFLLDSEMNRGRCIAVTQPRRVAAMSVAQRVADEMDVELGTYVGYTIRFEDKSTPQTVVKFLTDGMLLREAMADSQLQRYSVIVLDEAHERTIATDLLMGLLKPLVQRRDDLKVVVMSATLDKIKFSAYFDSAPIMEIPGRMHPVETYYSESSANDYLQAAVNAVLTIHTAEEDGDILLFLTGEEEIESAKRAIEKKVQQSPDAPELVCVALYGSLPPHMQQKIFVKAPGPSYPGGPPGRKCVIATNIAETSITIDGIVYVVDPGFSKQKVYNPRTRVESLLVTAISQASANQRAGRAGRTRPGKAFRLYTEGAFRFLHDVTHPEILRSSLSHIVLLMLNLGIQDLVHFDFMDPPAPETMMRALEDLHYLDALNDEGELTEIGRLMSQFPLDPQLAKILIESHRFKCSSEMITLCAMLSIPAVFVRPPGQSQEAENAKAKFAHEDGDHLTYLSVYHAYKKLPTGAERTWCNDNFLNPRSLAQADNIRSQLQRVVERGAIKIANQRSEEKDYYVNVRKCVVLGFFSQVAHLNKASHYLTLKDHQIVALHPSTVLSIKPEWVLYHEFVLTSKNFIRTCMTVRGEWLAELAPRYINDLPEGEAKRALDKLKRPGTYSEAAEPQHARRHAK